MSNLVIIQSKDSKPCFTTLLANYQLRYTQEDYRQQIDSDTAAVIICLEDKILENCKNLRQSGCFLPIICYGSKVPVTQIKMMQVIGGIFYIESGDEGKVQEFLLNRKQEVHNANRLLSIYWTGTSPRIQKFRNDVLQKGGVNDPLFIFGEPGTGKRAVAQYLFETSPYNDREWFELNLNNYSTAAYESHVWTALQGLYKKYETELAEVKLPIYSLLYIKGLEHKDILFLISLLEWLYEKRIDSENPFGNSIKVVIGLETPELISYIPKEFFDKYALLEVPTVRERREDLVAIVQVILAEYNKRFGRSIEGLTTRSWDFIMSNQWPGNIEELRYNLETAFLLIPAEKKVIDLQDFFVFEEQLFRYASNNTVQESTEKIKRYCGE